MALAREVVRGRGERAVGALAQRRLDGVELDLLVRRRRRASRCRPGRSCSCGTPTRRACRPCARRSSTSMTPARAQVRPGELLLARPDDLDRLARGLREARGLDRRVAGVLAAVRGAGVGDMTRAFSLGMRNAAASSSRTANGRCVPVQTVTLSPSRPFGDRGARLERRVRDVLDGVGLRELDVGGGEALLDVAGHARLGAARRARVGVLLEVLEDRRVRRLARRLGPLRALGERRDGALARCSASGATTPAKSPSRTTRTPGSASAFARVERGERRLEARPRAGPCRRACRGASCRRGSGARR